MEMIKAAGLKKYYVTDNYEVHASGYAATV